MNLKRTYTFQNEINKKYKYISPYSELFFIKVLRKMSFVANQKAYKSFLEMFSLIKKLRIWTIVYTK